MKKKIISTEYAPSAIGPYSQAVKIGKYIYVSGQIPLDPETGKIPDDISSQTKQCLENIKNILSASGSSLNNLLKTTIFLKNMDDFVEMNKAYGSFFKSHFPARSCVEVSKLPKDALIKIEAIALKEDN